MRRIMLLAAAFAASLASGAQAQKAVTFAYQDMLDPYRVLIQQKAIEKATGYTINWRQFGGGADVIRAMASGGVQVGEVGSSPAAAAASQGMDVEVFWILDDINQAEQLVARDGSGITSVADLRGKRVATPFVSTSHYSLLSALKKAGINPSDVHILNMRPPEIAAAWARGDIDATFIWDPVLSKIKANGKVITSAGDLGAPTFDAIMVNRSWAAKNKDFMTTLVRMMAQADANYRDHKPPGRRAARRSRPSRRSPARTRPTCPPRWRPTASRLFNSKPPPPGSAAAPKAELRRHCATRRSS